MAGRRESPLRQRSVRCASRDRSDQGLGVKTLYVDVLVDIGFLYSPSFLGSGDARRMARKLLEGTVRKMERLHMSHKRLLGRHCQQMHAPQLAQRKTYIDHCL